MVINERCGDDAGRGMDCTQTIDGFRFVGILDSDHETATINQTMNFNPRYFTQRGANRIGGPCWSNTGLFGS